MTSFLSGSRVTSAIATHIPISARIRRGPNTLTSQQWWVPVFLGSLQNERKRWLISEYVFSAWYYIGYKYNGSKLMGILVTVIDACIGGKLMNISVLMSI